MNGKYLPRSWTEVAMLNIELIEDAGLVVVRPDDALTKADFERVSSIVDPYLESHGNLNGLIIHTEHFPGWDSFGALLEHLRFVKDHHRKLTHVAVVTDSKVGVLGEKLGSHFVSAEIRHFPFLQFEQAKAWVLGRPA